MERKVGEVFEYNGVILRVKMKSLDSEDLCEGCFFNNSNNSCNDKNLGFCSKLFRADKKEVIFKRLK